VRNKETHTLTEPEKEPKAKKSADVIDLMEVLKKSLAKGGKASGRAGPHRAPAKRHAKKKRA
jgi:non-homologous end joining protein Ku